MIEIGTRVRIVGGAAAESGRLGTVIHVTAVGDGFLVEADEEFTVALGTYQRVETPSRRRRSWCAASEIVVVGGGAWAASAGRTRRPTSRQPATLPGAWRGGGRQRSRRSSSSSSGGRKGLRAIVRRRVPLGAGAGDLGGAGPCQQGGPLSTRTAWARPPILGRYESPRVWSWGGCLDGGVSPPRRA